MSGHQVSKGFLVDAECRVLNDLDAAGNQGVPAEHQGCVTDVHGCQDKQLKSQKRIG